MITILRDGITINEAAVIIGAPVDLIRRDVERDIISPVRSTAAGRARSVFHWADLTCLAALYDDHLFNERASFRKEAFSCFRRVATASIYPIIALDEPAAASTASYAWTSSLRLLHTELSTCRNVYAAIAPYVPNIIAHHGISGFGGWGSGGFTGSPFEDPPTAHESWILPVGVSLTLNLKPAVDRITPTAALFAAGLDRIETDPERMGGLPVFASTRLSVHHIGSMYRNGGTLEEIVEDYPVLTAADVEFAKLFVEANPLKGRPRKESPARGRDEVSP